MNYGLLPKTEDERDINVGAIVVLPKLSELPDEYQVASSYIYDQGPTDTCAGCASAKISSLQEGWKLDPLFTWMMARQIANMKPDDWGVELRPMASAHVKVGALKLSEAPYTVNDDPKVWRDITNWNVAALLKQSILHKKSSYVWVTPSDGLIAGYDMFDTLRATQWKFRNNTNSEGKKVGIAIVIGTHWSYPANEPDIVNWKEGGFGHAHVFSGWTKRGAEIRCVDINSWGEGVGDKGKFYISREVINKEVPIFGAFFFHDETPDRLRWHVENGVKLDDGLLYGILRAFYVALRDLRAKTQSYVASIFRS